MNNTETSPKPEPTEQMTSEALVHRLLTGREFLDDENEARRLVAELVAQKLNAAADEFVASCPDHGSADLCDMVCRCGAADELRRMAKRPAAAVGVR